MTPVSRQRSVGNPSSLPRQKPELKWSPAPVVILGLGVKGPSTSETPSGPEASARAFDKHRSKRTFRRAGLATDLFDATRVASCRMYHDA